MQNRAKEIAADYLSGMFRTVKVTADDMYIVWFCKTLQNWKTLVSTDVIHGIYFEITHNGDKNETYVDVYAKSKNYVVK